MPEPMIDGASYTMTLRDVCKRYDIGLMDYPIFDEGYRLPLNRKIRDHFWLREIGQETPDMFIFMLNRTMREIMPPMNELYRTVKLSYDPLSTIDMSTLSAGHSDNAATSTSENDSTTTASNKTRQVNSEFPQTMLETEQDYATGAGDVTSRSDGSQADQSTAESKSNSDSTMTTSTVGRQGSGASLIMEYRAAIMNVDMDVVHSLDGLFMGLWHNGDTRRDNMNYPIFPGYALNFGYLF